MRKHLRTLFTLFFALLCTLCLVVGLTACDPDDSGKVDPPDGDKHEHSWASGWSSDETNHWHAPSCDDTTELKDKAAHVDADEDGKCDVCDYEVGHEHTWGDEWYGGAEGHWHTATCSHTTATSTPQDHVDEDGDLYCDLCDWEIAHAYADEYMVDDMGHWHEVLCGHDYAEDASFEMHDFSKDGKCVCGVEDIEPVIYNDYYKVYSQFKGEEVLDFNDWHYSLVEDGVTHVEKTDEGNVVYTYDEGVTEIAYYADRSVKVTLTRGNGMSQEVSFPKVSYKVIAVVSGEDDEKEVEVATFASDVTGEVTAEFTPYYGLSGADVTYKLVIDKVDGNFVAIGGDQTVSVTENAEVAELGYEIWAALGVGTNAKIPSVNIGAAADTTEAYDSSEQSFGLKAPAGWYWLEYETSGANVDVYAIINGRAYLIYNKINSTAQQKGLVYVPEGATQITLRRAYGTLADGCSVSLTAYDAYNVNKVGEEFYLVATAVGNNLYFPLNLPAGDYLFTVASASDTGSSYYFQQTPTAVTIGDKTVTRAALTTSTYSTSWTTIATVGEGDNTIAIKGSMHADSMGGVTGNFIVSVKFDDTSSLEKATLGDNSVTFSASAKTHYRSFTAETEGTYAITGTYTYSNSSTSTSAGSGLRYTRVGIGSSEDNVIAQFTTYRYTAGGVFYLKAGQSVILNINYGYTSYYGTFNYNIALASVATLTAGEASNVALSADQIYGVVSFTAPEAGTYPLSLALASGSSATNLTNVMIINGKTGATIVPKATLASKTTYSMFVTLEKGETVVYAFVYESSYASNSTSFKLPTIAVTMGNVITPKALEANTSVQLTISNTSQSEMYSFTAPEAGSYRLVVSSATGFRYLKISNSDGSSYVSVTSTTYYTSSAVLQLAKGETVTLIVEYSNTTTTTYYANLSINYETAEATTKIEANTATEIDFSGDSVVKYYSFTAPEAGTYRVFLSSANSVARVYLYKNGTTTQLVTATTTANTKFLTATVTLAKDEVVRIEAFYNPTTASPSFNPVYLGFYLANDTTTQKIEEANKAVEVSLSLTSQVKYYSFTATADATYKLIATSETSIAYLRVYKAGTTTSYIYQTTAGTYVSADVALKQGETLVLEFYYQPAASATVTSYPFTVSFSVNYVEPKAVEVNTKTNVTFSKDAQLASYKFKATDAGVYTLILTGDTLQNVHVVNGDGTNVITKITSALTFTSCSLNLTEGQEYVLTFIYEAGSAYPTITFEVNRDSGDELKVNEDKTVTFHEGDYTKYLSFTATEEAYYTIVLSSATDLKNVKILDADTGATVLAKIADSKTFNLSTYKLTAGQKITLLLVYEATSDHPEVTVRVEYSTPTELTLNQATEFKFNGTNVAEYYSFTATDAYAYALQLEAENLQNVTVYNAATGAVLVGKIADNRAVNVTVSTALNLTAGTKLTLLFVYDGAISGECGVKVTFVKSNVEDVSNGTKVTFSSGNNVKHIKFTASTEETLAVSLTADEGSSLDNVAFYNPSTGAAVTLPVKIAFKSGDTYELIVCYSGTDYPTLTFNAEEALLAPTITMALHRLVIWDAVPGATSYKVYYSTTANGTYNYAGETSELYYHVDGINPASNSNLYFYYKVKACNAKGESDFSEYKSTQSVRALSRVTAVTIAVEVPEGFPASPEAPVYLILNVGDKYWNNGLGNVYDNVCIKITGAGTFSATGNSIGEAVAGLYGTRATTKEEQSAYDWPEYLYYSSGLPEGWTYTAGSYVSSGTTTGTITKA